MEPTANIKGNTHRFRCAADFGASSTAESRHLSGFFTGINGRQVIAIRIHADVTQNCLSHARRSLRLCEVLLQQTNIESYLTTFLCSAWVRCFTNNTTETEKFNTFSKITCSFGYKRLELCFQLIILVASRGLFSGASFVSFERIHLRLDVIYLLLECLPHRRRGGFFSFTQQFSTVVGSLFLSDPTGLNQRSEFALNLSGRGRCYCRRLCSFSSSRFCNIRDRRNHSIWFRSNSFGGADGSGSASHWNACSTCFWLRSCNTWGLRLYWGWSKLGLELRQLGTGLFSAVTPHKVVLDVSKDSVSLRRVLKIFAQHAPIDRLLFTDAEGFNVSGLQASRRGFTHLADLGLFDSCCGLLFSRCRDFFTGCDRCCCRFFGSHELFGCFAGGALLLNVRYVERLAFFSRQLQRLITLLGFRKRLQLFAVQNKFSVGVGQGWDLRRRRCWGLRSSFSRSLFGSKALSTLDGRFPGYSIRSRLRSTCATTQGQVHQALHDGTSSTAVGCLFTQPLDEFLLRLVDALGDQVLRETGCCFLRSFLTTCKRSTLDQLDALSLGSIGNTRQDAEGCKDFHRPGDDA